MGRRPRRPADGFRSRPLARPTRSSPSSSPPEPTTNNARHRDLRHRPRLLPYRRRLAHARRQHPRLPSRYDRPAEGAACRNVALAGRQLSLRVRMARRHRRSRQAPASPRPRPIRLPAQRRRHRRIHDPDGPPGRGPVHQRQCRLRRRLVGGAVGRVLQRRGHYSHGQTARGQRPPRALQDQVVGHRQ